MHKDSSEPLAREILANPLGAVRSRCAAVARRARRVRIVESGLDRLAADLPPREIEEVNALSAPPLGSGDEDRAAFILCLDAINFGSGWFPLLNKLPGHSGYRTIEVQVGRWVQRSGTPSADDLRQADAPSMARLLGQENAPAEVRELMTLFARAWRDLGDLLHQSYDGSFAQLVAAAGQSAAELVRILLTMPLYRDLASYDSLVVPFFKRAQITAADLAAALPAPLGLFTDLDQLTAFADNLVPHVLRVDGVLCYEPSLLARIERGELLRLGSPEEVEIRACAVTAVEGLRSRIAERGVSAHSAQIDGWLWTRGGRPTYKSQPRHRTRSPFY